MNRILLVDGNSLLFRAYYATAYNNDNILRDFSGTPTNALVGFANMLNRIMKENDYYSVVVAFDKGKKTFRHDKLTDYKAGRAKTPEELIVQFPIVKEFLDSYGIPYLEEDNYEADDLIGGLTKLAVSNNFYVDILSSDKDLFQLISNNTRLLNTRKGISDIEIYDEDKLYERYNIKPHQIPDLKGLMGDTSDNLKGVSGIGEKTAIKLISEYETLENLYNNIDNLKGSVKEKLIKDKDMAFLCKDIATIYCDLKMNDFKFERHNYSEEQLISFYEKYNMNSFINKLNGNSSKKEENLNINIINNWDEKYQDNESVIYLEFLEENYHLASLIGFGIANSKGNFYYDFEEAKYDEKFLSYLKNNEFKKITYNAKALIVALHRFNIEVEGIVYDLMLAGYVANPNYKNSLSTYVQLYANKKIDEEDIFYGKGAKQSIPHDQNLLANYIGTKAYYINIVKNKINEVLISNEQYHLYEDIELPTMFALARMEINGVKVDTVELEKQSIRIKAILDNLNQEINDLAQTEVNPNSPKQISQLLYKDLGLPDYKKGSTSQDVLESIRSTHPIVDKLLDYRKYHKLYSTYLNGMNKYIFKDGKVHTLYRQTLTNTGRVSSTEPNMQNISIRDEIQKEVRKIFVVSNPDYVFLSADYSQIELRVLAHMSEDTNMINAFKNDIDIHSDTAIKIFHLSNINEVTSDLRRIAKTVNFGIIYGISDFRLSNDLNISIPEAKNIIQTYYNQFPTIRAFIDNQIKYCQQHGYISTIFNRKRYVPEINDRNYTIREFGKRVAMNMPIQGSAADIMKIALAQIDQNIIDQKLDIKIIAQIHDELIFEVHKDILDKAQSLIKDVMENAVKLKVPLTVDLRIGKSWYDLK